MISKTPVVYNLQYLCMLWERTMFFLVPHLSQQSFICFCLQSNVMDARKWQALFCVPGRSSVGWRTEDMDNRSSQESRREKTALAHILVLSFSSVTLSLCYWTRCPISYIPRWNGIRSLGLYMLLTKCLEQCLIQNTGSVILTTLFILFFFLIFDLTRKRTVLCVESQVIQISFQYRTLNYTDRRLWYCFPPIPSFYYP